MEGCGKKEDTVFIQAGRQDLTPVMTSGITRRGTGNPAVVSKRGLSPARVREDDGKTNP
jgi:hypothetical protein